MNDWQEDKHPRDNDGKFTSKGGGKELTPNESKRLKELNITNKAKPIQLPPQEYAELDSAIRTKYGNKIPKIGAALYKDSFYVYNYSKRQEKMVCTFKVQIQGNEDLIKGWLKDYE